MAADIIIFNKTNVTTATRAQGGRNAVSAFRQAQILMQTEVAAMNHMFVSGDPVDFTVLETQYGLDAGKGQAVFDLFNGALQAINGQSQNSQGLLMVAQLS